jgi:hypothetical protein
MNSLSFQIIGEEYPVPGTGIFQATLVFKSQCTGKLVSELVPSPFGPRHEGQFCACKTDMELIIRKNRKKLKNLRIIISYVFKIKMNYGFGQK